MRGVLVAAVAVLCGSVPTHAQLPTSTWPAGFHPTPEFWIDPEIRLLLSRAWTDQVGQNERGYCVAVSVVEGNDRPVFTVVGLTKPVIKFATPTSMNFECDSGLIMLHVHPPQTRVVSATGPVTYVAGGLEAYQCWPSDVDQRTLFRGSAPLALIQCDRNAIMVYWNPTYLTALARQQDRQREERLHILQPAAFPPLHFDSVFYRPPQ